MKTLTIAFVLTLSLIFTACGSKPMTDADMAAKYGLSLEEYQEQKEAAARMNMSIEDHLNMGHEGMDHGSMNNTKTDAEIQAEYGMSDEALARHKKAAENMGMTLQQHIDAGHVGH